MTDLIPFLFDRKPVRVMPMGDSFQVVAKDVAEALGYEWNGAARIAHVPQEWRGVTSVVTPGGTQQVLTLLEPGLYFFLNRSDKQGALPMQKWVAGEVLPSIRKTGSFSVKQMTPAEMFLASAEAMLNLERQQAATQQNMARIEHRVDDLAESRVWDHCPQNCEPITKIRARMQKRHGLPPWVIDLVVRGLPLSPKPFGMVRNNHEHAEGAHYAVWATADITRVFDRFVRECVQVTATYASHPDIAQRFKLTAKDLEEA